ncbi:MAG: peptidoglycan editing factor PgeF [Candidatus Omnitrophota bacterium]
MDFIRAFSARSDGNMSLSCGDTRDSLNSRKAFLGGLGVDWRDLVCAKQAHGAGVRLIRQSDSGKGSLDWQDAIADTDAFVTDKKNIPLAVFTADCLAVFLYDPIRPAIGLIHAGWRSSKEDIVKKTIQLMEKEFKAQAPLIKAFFSPAIRSCCYEVGEELEGIFGRAVIKREGRYYLDLAAVNRQGLLDAGLKQENISDPGTCTSCRNKDFFSFRKEGQPCGRQMAVAVIR